MTNSFPNNGASARAASSRLGFNAARAASATGAKLKCQGSGWTPDRIHRKGRKNPNRSAWSCSHPSSGPNGPGGAYSSAVSCTR